MAINYIDGSATTPNSANFAGTSPVVLGTFVFEHPALDTPDDTILGNQLAFGATNPEVRAGSLSDRAPNAPSGYDVNGNPTYGSGPLNRVTTWKADHSLGPSGSFRIFSPRGPTKGLYTSLD